MTEALARRIAAGETSIESAIKETTARADERRARPVAISRDTTGRAAAVLFLIDPKKNVGRAQCVMLERQSSWEVVAQSGVAWNIYDSPATDRQPQTEVLLEARAPLEDEAFEIAAVIGKTPSAQIRVVWSHGDRTEKVVDANGYFVICAVVPIDAKISVA